MDTFKSADIPEKVIKYEHFLNETLRADMKRNEEEQGLILGQMTDHRQLRVFLNQLKSQSFGSDSKQLKVQTDLGSNFYVQAILNDKSRVLMYCGLGIYLEMDLDHALHFSEKREKLLEQKLNTLIKQANKIKATTKLVFEGLRELQQLNS